MTSTPLLLVQVLHLLLVLLLLLLMLLLILLLLTCTAEEDPAAVLPAVAGHQVPPVVRGGEGGRRHVGVELDLLSDALLLCCVLQVPGK